MRGFLRRPRPFPEETTPGVGRVYTARDLPGETIASASFRPSPTSRRWRSKQARFRGEAVAIVVGDPALRWPISTRRLPVSWEPLPHALTMDEATADGFEPLHAERG
jgi:aldehyde oxidoreductase